MWPKACPRCHGDLYTQVYSEIEVELTCLQCGRVLNALQARLLRASHRRPRHEHEAAHVVKNAPALHRQVPSVLGKPMVRKRDDAEMAGFGYWPKPPEWIRQWQRPRRCRIKGDEVDGRLDRLKGEDTQMLANAAELKHACKALGRRALIEGKSTLPRRFNLVLVHGMVPGQDDSSWIRSVAEDLLSDEMTGAMLRRELNRAGAGDCPDRWTPRA